MTAYLITLVVLLIAAGCLAHHLTPRPQTPRRPNPLISTIIGLLRPPMLIAMRYDEMHVVHPNTDVNHVCHQCGHLLGIYPSGQTLLKKYPRATINCNHCKPDWTKYGYAPGALAELGQGTVRVSSSPR